jgi:hypothetical protein
MAVAIASVGTVVSIDNLNSLVTSAPAGLTTGDLELLFSLRAGTNLAFDTPSNWTLLENAADNFNASRMQAWWRIADGSGSDAPTLTRSSASNCDAHASILRITGHDAVTPINAAESTGASASTTSPPVTSITTTEANCLLITGFGTSGVLITGTPSGWTQKALTNAVTNVTAELAIYSLDAVSAGAYGGQTATLASSTRYTNAVIAIKPAAGGGSPASPYPYSICI